MRGKGDDRGWDGWMASPTQWTWIWVGSRSWWWTEKPGKLQSIGSQRVGHDQVTELNWPEQSIFNKRTYFLLLRKYKHVVLVYLLNCVQLFATLWTAACQASLSITNSWSLLRFMPMESVMSSNHFILCCLFLLLPSTFPSIRVFSNQSVLHIRWPKYWNFNFSISPSSECSGLISFRMD